MNATNLLVLVVLVASAVGWPQPPPPPPPGGEDIPEECRPKPPQHGKERVVCCDMPHPAAKDSEHFKNFFDECMEEMKSKHPEGMPPHHPYPQPPPPPPAGGAPPPPPPPHHGGPRLFMKCMDACLFNKSGLMTDKKLNEEALTKMVDSFAQDSAWKSVAVEATKFCYEKSSETTEDEKEGKCNPVPHDFLKCLIKQMYLKCPSDKWQNNDECNAEKQIMEKCPNLIPFPPHPPMKKKE